VRNARKGGVKRGKAKGLKRGFNYAGGTTRKKKVGKTDAEASTHAWEDQIEARRQAKKQGTIDSVKGKWERGGTAERDMPKRCGGGSDGVCERKKKNISNWTGGGFPGEARGKRRIQGTFGKDAGKKENGRRNGGGGSKRFAQHQETCDTKGRGKFEIRAQG